MITGLRPICDRPSANNSRGESNLGSHGAVGAVLPVAVFRFLGYKFFDVSVSVFVSHCSDFAGFGFPGS